MTRLEPENLKGKNQVGDLGVCGTDIVKMHLKEWDEGTDWIHVAQDRVQWTLVNMLINFWHPLNDGISHLVSEYQFLNK